jgi:hypothetical protein
MRYHDGQCRVYLPAPSNGGLLFHRRSIKSGDLAAFLGAKVRKGLCGKLTSAGNQGHVFMTRKMNRLINVILRPESMRIPSVARLASSPGEGILQAQRGINVASTYIHQPSEELFNQCQCPG